MITFRPDENFNGTGSFTYTASDGSGGTATALVTVAVDGVNDAPVAGADTAITTEDTALVIGTSALLANDSDVDGDVLSVTAVSEAVGGRAVLSDGMITFTPDENFYGIGSFTYTVSDGAGGTATELAVVMVAEVNDVPVIETVTPTPGVGNTWTLLVVATDSDGDPMAITIAGADELIPVSVTSEFGVFSVVADSDWARAHPGAQVPVRVTVTDGRGGTTRTTAVIGTANNAIILGYINSVPTDVPALPAGVTYTQAAAGFQHTVLLRSDGRAVAVGMNSTGAVVIPALPDGLSYTQVSARGENTVLLRSDGSAVGVGLGFDFGGVTIPDLPEGLTYTHVAAGHAYMVLGRSDGSAVAVAVYSGEITIPALPAGLSYVGVAAGGLHMVFVTGSSPVTP